jgi:polyhydroxyalkanoate synthesis regulator phasin
MEDLYKLIETGDEWAQQQASIALGVADAYAKGEITSEEYQEMLQDMARSIEIDEEASDLELKTMVVSALYGASMVL